jgi:acyl-CoA dehydrogenase
MTDTLTTASRIFADHCTGAALRAAEDGVWPDLLWQRCVEAGLHLALIDVGDESLGVPVAEAFGIARLAGHHAAPIPLVESMLGNWLLGRLGLPARDKPIVVADATADRVPWGRSAAVFVPNATAPTLSLIEGGRAVARAGLNLAKEPRDRLRLVPSEVHEFRMPNGLDALRLRAASAALRTAQMAGAMDSIAAMAIRYATERVQFGKPLAKFQAIQHSAAILASQAAAAGCAADIAADAFANGIDVAGIASAKAFCGEAAGIATDLAHQIHGAIGFSRDYGLHHRTKRLWSWRDENGNDTEWAAYLGHQVAQAGADNLWAEITAL